MKRTALALTAAIAMSGITSAQNYLVDNPDNAPYFGVRIGVDISSTAGQVYDTYNNGAGFTIGAIYNIPVYKNLYFEPGLSLFYNTFGFTVATSDNPDGFLAEVDGSIRNLGFRIPLNIGYRFDFTDDISVSLFTGPVLNTNLTAKEHFMDKTTSIMSNGFKRFDMQWDFGIAMTYGSHYYVSVSGGIGVTRAYSTPIDHFRRNTCNIAVGYNF